MVTKELKDYIPKTEIVVTCPVSRTITIMNRNYFECTLEGYEHLVCKGVLYYVNDNKYHCTLIDRMMDK
jgi:hypothetical protein